MTTEQQKSVVRALDDAGVAIGRGAETNAALAKAAATHKVTAEFVPALVRAYNKGRTLAHLNSAASEKRAEEFPLASENAVMGVMYPDDSTERFGKVASSLQRKESIDFMVESPPQTAQEIITKRAEPIPFDKGMMYGAMMRGIDSVERLIGADKTECHVLGERLKDQLRKAAEHFRRLTHVPFAVIDANIKSAYGDVGERTMDAVWGLLPKGLLSDEKRAARPQAIPTFSERDEPYNAILAAMKTGEELNEKVARLAENMDKLEATKAEVLPKPAEEGGPVEQAGGFRKRAGVLDIALGNYLAEVVPTVKPVKEQISEQAKGDIGGVMDAISDPAHEQQLRVYETQALLNNLMWSDPVVAKADPNMVIEKFNELMRLAPRVAMDPAAVRGAMRRMLQGEPIEPFETGQLLDVEQKLQKLEQPELGVGETATA
jgi:hypothetical protein